MLSIREVLTPWDLEAARWLFQAYLETPGVAECVIGFEAEMEGLPGRYAQPDGDLLVASLDGRPIGCVALRKAAEGICEMKRLFTRPEARGSGVGRALAERLIARAQAKGYRLMRLDTLPSMEAAVRLYESLGFRRIGRFYDAAPVTALFFELELQPGTDG